jgi:hypothetical protein
LRLAQVLGARRFEAQIRGVSAMLALRGGDRDGAHALSDTALAICRKHGMGYIGPWIFGVCARIETDVQTRKQLLAAGEAQLAHGCVSHNYLWLRELAIDVSLEIGDWDAVEANCARLRQYTHAEPLPLSDFAITRGLTLARFGRGERSAELRTTLAGLRDLAASAELNVALSAIDNAVHGFETRPVL